MIHVYVVAVWVDGWVDVGVFIDVVVLVHSRTKRAEPDTACTAPDPTAAPCLDPLEPSTDTGPGPGAGPNPNRIPAAGDAATRHPLSEAQTGA